MVDGEIIVTKKQLRRVLFWAAVGIEKSRGGSFRDTPAIVKELAEKAGLKKSNFASGKFPEFQP